MDLGDLNEVCNQAAYLTKVPKRRVHIEKPLLMCMLDHQ